MSNFKVGDLVVFGRPNGEQTNGVVVRVNKSSLTIEQTEERGQTRIRTAGAKWRVHPSLVTKVGGRGAAPSRPEAEIIADLRRVEAGLSPENLHADGERSRAEARLRAGALNAQKQMLIAELGRYPTPKELWGL